MIFFYKKGIDQAEIFSHSAELNRPKLLRFQFLYNQTAKQASLSLEKVKIMV